jgi:cytochrome c553
LIESGRKLALGGVPEGGIPPCITCHGTPGTSYPRLAGQHAAYLAGQLRLWKAGHVPQTDIAAPMAAVGQRLSDDQINAVSAYFATLPPEPREARLP